MLSYTPGGKIVHIQTDRTLMCLHTHIATARESKIVHSL